MDQLETITQKLKASPHWRDDFRVVESKTAQGTSVYYVEANDQESSTALAIAQLDQVLRSTSRGN